MQEAASYLVGEHDFKSFCSVNTAVLTTVRTIYSCEVIQEGEIIRIRISGNGFLYNMVRIIAGTLLEVGRGNIPPVKIKEILDAKSREQAGPTAPAKGLCLQKIEYPVLDSWEKRL